LDLLDASSPLPLYHQLAKELFAQIQGEALGCVMPAEHGSKATPLAAS
jgi:hypothetical protein